MARTANQPIDVWKYIEMPPDGDEKPCWPWTGGTGGRADDQRGYFTMKGVKYLAYRVVYELVHGALAEGEVVRHKCDNPICCNPYHLIKGTHSDNEKDKYERDRYGFPVKVVERIVELGQQQLPQKAISAILERELGIAVSQQRVSDIIRGTRRAAQAEAVRRSLKRQERALAKVKERESDNGRETEEEEEEETSSGG